MIVFRFPYFTINSVSAAVSVPAVSARSAAVRRPDSAASAGAPRGADAQRALAAQGGDVRPSHADTLAQGLQLPADGGAREGRGPRRGLQGEVRLGWNSI